MNGRGGYGDEKWTYKGKIVQYEGKNRIKILEIYKINEILQKFKNNIYLKYFFNHLPRGSRTRPCGNKCS